MEIANNRIIAKNTVFLYVRMIFVMLVTLYTSRVILQVLGIDDYGLYQTVGGVVGFLAFINNALSSASSRYITFAIGKGDDNELRETFSTTLTAHILIGFFIALLAETVGLWYVYNRMIIPDGRFEAAVIVFHISIVTILISVMQVPFNAEVIAHEKMSVYAYIGLFEALSKLGIVYLLMIGRIDKLVLYAVLLLLINVIIFCFYVVYSKKHFNETSFRLHLDRRLFVEIFSFSGWSLFGNGAMALSNQGILLLLNLFFAPAVVTARSISLQVSNVATQFVGNFRTAVNPQIVKRYAAEDYDGSKSLLLESTKFSYYLMLIIALPIFLMAEPLLDIWLVEVPEYTVVFLQIVVVQSLFQVFNTSFQSALYAKGRIKENALVSPLVLLLVFPIVYLLFDRGASPVALSWAYLVGYIILGLVVKPILLYKIVDYKWSEITGVYKVCFAVTFAAVPIPLFLSYWIGVDNITSCAIVLFVCWLSVAVFVWTLGLTKSMKERFKRIVLDKLAQTSKRNENRNTDISAK